MKLPFCFLSQGCRKLSARRGYLVTTGCGNSTCNQLTILGEGAQRFLFACWRVSREVPKKTTFVRITVSSSSQHRREKQLVVRCGTTRKCQHEI
jgi:hypothetical protein